MDNYEITISWPDGRKFSQGGYTHDAAMAMSDFLWEAGADDVKVICACGNCETCYDRASWSRQDG